MRFDNDIDEARNKWLCFRCVGEDFLKRDIRINGKRRKCSYCEKMGNAYSIEEMSEQIKTAFSEHYIRTPDQPSPFEYAMLEGRCWERDGEEVTYAIMNAADIPEDAASDIQKILENEFEDFEAATMGEESEFGPQTYYAEKGTDDSSWQMEWRQLELSLKSQARFFNHFAAKHLATIFDGLEAMKTRDDRPMIVNGGPGTALVDIYRARVFQSDKSLEVALEKPDQHIGPPKSADAIGGRMNANGISVFYGANDPKVALAEVRPPVGSQVVVARFAIIRNIRLLDLTTLENIMTKGSIFDPVFNSRLEQAMFLRSLSQRITKPVMPEDEAFEYLPTQAIADFLANEATINIDGIIFPSIQANGQALNVALFHKAAKIEEIELPAGTEVSVSLGSMNEDGWEVNYCVTEQVPREEENADKSQQPFSFSDSGLHNLRDWDDDDGSFRKVTLKIDLQSLKVHIVEAVKFTTYEHPVSRYRFEKHENNF